MCIENIATDEAKCRTASNTESYIHKLSGTLNNESLFLAIWLGAQTAAIFGDQDIIYFSNYSPKNQQNSRISLAAYS